MENATINSNGAGDNETEVQSVEQAPDSFTQLIEKPYGTDDKPEVESAAKEPITGEIDHFTLSVSPGNGWLMANIWPEVFESLIKHGLCGAFDPYTLFLSVWMTESTSDPDIIHKAWGCIILVAQVGCSRNYAIYGLDARSYYDYIKTGHQDGGLAAVNKIAEEVYIKKRPCVYKHLKALAKACSCHLKFREDKDFILVGASALERLRRFRKAVERCILEDIDPEAHAKELHDKFGQHRTLNNAIQTVKDLKI